MKLADVRSCHHSSTSLLSLPSVGSCRRHRRQVVCAGSVSGSLHDGRFTDIHSWHRPVYINLCTVYSGL